MSAAPASALPSAPVRSRPPGDPNVHAARPAPPPTAVIDDAVDRALIEDLGSAGDLSTDATIGRNVQVAGRVVTREPGCIAGLAAASRVFARAGDGLRLSAEVQDGDHVDAGATLFTLEGSAHTALIGERTALNILGHLSGIATATANVVAAVAGSGARITDTRKTTPGLRALEKYAVRCGGGVNHRFGLYDAVLLKDNHLVAAGSITAAVGAARAQVGHTVTIEVEIDRLDQLPEVLAAGADILLLDNMDPATMRAAVQQVDGRLVTEASGGITLENVRGVAATGVDVISLGWLTHSAPRLDVALDLDGA